MSIKQGISEDYPISFNMDEFKSLASFKARVDYAKERLKRLGSGSSRVVFQIDDEKVLKIAKNQKGIVQNEKESDHSNDYYLKNLVAEVFDSHPDFHWIEMQLAERVKPSKFKEITGVDIKDLEHYLRNGKETNNGRRTIFLMNPELKSSMDDNEFVQTILDYMINYDMLAGDLGQITSYGLLKKNGIEDVVLIDYGVDDDIYSKFYDKTKKMVREIVEEFLFEEEEIYGWKEVNNHIKNITPNEDDIPDYFMEIIIKGRRFKK